MDGNHGADFSFFIRSLAMQASIGLGLIDNPITNKREKNLPHAGLIIDTIEMLKEKTQGNLTTDEDSLIDKLLFELKNQISAARKSGAQEGVL